MASELFHLLSEYNYTRQVIHLTQKDVLTQKVFPHMPLSTMYWLDMCRCYKHRKKNVQQLFELFATFNEEDALNVRSEMIKCIRQEKSFYESVRYNHLKRMKLSLDDWLQLMSSDSNFADELMLYALSRTY